MVGWDEILTPGVPNNIVIQSWRGPESLTAAAKQGYRGLLSNGYYIDLMWSAARHYAVDPMSGATADLTISKGYPFLENDPELTTAVRTIAEAHFGAENIETLPIRLTSEDFSYYAQEIPVCFFRLGVRNEEKGIVYGVHHPKFNIDDRALVVGIQAMTLAPFS